jgi:hypothetical protein
VRIVIGICLLCLLLPSVLIGHHGVASLGVAGLKGPGAPIETSTSATLPKGSCLVYTKLDYVRFQRLTPARDDEGDTNAFWMYGFGYGLRSYLSIYLFVPYYTKKLEDNSFNTSGFADLSLMGVLGFKYDEGFRRVPSSESLDDLEDWHFTLFGGATLPTGDANFADADGTIDPGMSLGFGKPSYTMGTTATKQLTERLTWVADASLITFSEYEYADGNRTRFGDEVRFNAAISYRCFTRIDSDLRVDGNFEGNYLRLGRDRSNGVDERGTGGDIVYLVPGIRLYYKSISVGVAMKVPGWTDLNEEPEQQGAEGKEDYRGIFTFSLLLR